MAIRRRAGEDMETGIAAARKAAEAAALRLVKVVAEEGFDSGDFNSALVNSDEYDEFESALSRLNELSIPE